MAIYNDPSRMINQAGMDEVVNMQRTRATLANPMGINYIEGYGTPTSLNPAGTVTVTAAQLLTGIVVINPSAPNTTTLDTAANLLTAVGNLSSTVQIGDIVTCLIINGQGTNSLTMAAGAGGAFDANQLAASQIIPANSSKYIMIRFTNVTLGSAAYVVYC